MAKFFTPSKLSENIRETPEGYLLCLGVPIARTGWQEYGPGESPLEVGDDGIAWAYRDPKEVFRPQTIASFQAKSITIKHPIDFVTPANWKTLSHGVAQNVRKGEEKDEDDQEMLIADLLITDDIAIGLVKNGLREISCGYDAEYEQTGKGEGRQFNIIGNHIALVESGRAGDTYAIKDQKREEPMFDKLLEQIKALTKTVDEAVATQKKTKDSLAAKKAKKAVKTGDATPEQVSYDDVMKHIKDLAEKIDGMKGEGEGKDDDDAYDDDDEEEPSKKKEEQADDDDEEKSENEAEGEILERVKALEAAVAKMLKSKAGDDDEEEEKESTDDDDDMSGDDDEEEEESEATDEEGQEGEESQKKSTGDASRIETLTPGKKFKGKDARAKCVAAFAKTEDGKAVLKQLGLKKLVLDSKNNVDMIFMAASSLMKSQRGVGLEGTKDIAKAKRYTADDVDNTANGGMTAEQMNEMNAKHYGLAK